MAMTTWDRNFFLIVGALCVTLWLTGCTVYMPQAHLQPQVARHLGRPLTDAEVDIREEVVGVAIYTKCGTAGYMAALTITPLHGCARLLCGEDKAWKTDKPCTCPVYLLNDWDRAMEHELRHCYGWGEL